MSYKYTWFASNHFHAVELLPAPVYWWKAGNEPVEPGDADGIVYVPVRLLEQLFNLADAFDLAKLSVKVLTEENERLRSSTAMLRNEVNLMIKHGNGETAPLVSRHMDILEENERLQNELAEAKYRADPDVLSLWRQDMERAAHERAAEICENMAARATLKNPSHSLRLAAARIRQATRHDASLQDKPPATDS